MAYQIYWQTKVRRGQIFSLTDGRSVKILNPGLLNRDSGPDFFNAKIEIEGQSWAGNIEIHEHASDWQRHAHSKDPAYKNVILHVVAYNDCEIEVNNEKLPTLQLAIPPSFLHAYQELKTASNGMRCASRLSLVASLYRREWLDAMLAMRISQKSEKVYELLKLYNGDWQQTFFVVLARALGFGLNADPFEILGRSLPLNYLRRHCDDIFQLEAIIFGQAGMFSPLMVDGDSYYQRLYAEYTFLSNKYGLAPPSGCLWKMSRTRPANFPHRRMALLAVYSSHIDNIFSKILEAEGDLELLSEAFSLSPSSYWERHYSFSSGKKEGGILQQRCLTSATLSLIFINAVVPIYQAYGAMCGKTSLMQAARRLLYSLPAESNSIIRAWGLVGIRADNAADSQALLCLTKNYCRASLCHQCRWGVRAFLLS